MDFENTVKKFFPLVAILSLVLAATILTQYLNNSWSVMAFMTSYMAYFFLLFGGFKIYNLQAFATAYAEYDIIAQKSRAYALAYPFIEFGLGLAYFFDVAPLLSNSITLVIMSISSVGVALKLAKREQITCACLGVVFKIPMTYVSLLEDTVMEFMALYMLIMHLI